MSAAKFLCVKAARNNLQDIHSPIYPCINDWLGHLGTSSSTRKFGWCLL